MDLVVHSGIGVGKTSCACGLTAGRKAAAGMVRGFSRASLGSTGFFVWLRSVDTGRYRYDDGLMRGACWHERWSAELVQCSQPFSVCSRPLSITTYQQGCGSREFARSPWTCSTLCAVSVGQPFYIIAFGNLDPWHLWELRYQAAGSWASSREPP